MTEPYRVRSPETWSAAREAYTSGLSAEEACARFDLGLSAFRKRAREEGWRRLDQDDPAPDDADDDALPDIDDEALAALAFRRMSVEARKGRLNQALAWGRLRDMALRQTADRSRVQATLDRAAHRDSLAAFREINETAKTIVHSARVVKSVAGLAEVHDVHDVHPPQPTSRADRRRQAARARKIGPP
ncbi:MAG: hypothetical protein V4701_00665 [Pseudomonadota bacterium]